MLTFRSIQKMRLQLRMERTFAFVLAMLAISAAAGLMATSETARAAKAKPDANASQAAWMEVYRVLTSPRCQNCHPAGDAPLQGDDSHVHLQNVRRGKDGHGVYAMKCDTCHQATNLPGVHMPPGNPKWALPPAEQKMVFVGRSPGELCKQIKDPKQNGGRTLEQIFHHIAEDDLVSWGWDPGAGRTQPPLSRPDTVAQLKIWMDGGATCPAADAK
jgi:mono/diheme cytochrome c family protein